MPTRVLYPTYTIGSWAANVDDDFGCRWVVTSQTLYGGSGRKTHTQERPFGTGAYRARSYLAGRSDLLQGWCQAPDRASARAAQDRFKALFPSGGQDVLLLDDGISPRQLTVEAAEAAPKCEPWADAQGFDWQLPLLSADPRWLDTTVRSAVTTVGSASTDGLNWGPPDPMFVNVGAASEGSNAPRTPGMPPGILAGDPLLCFAAIRNSGAGTPDQPAGYTTLVDGSNMRLFGKIYDGSEGPPTVTFTGGVSGATNHAQMAALRGVGLSVLGSPATLLNASAQDVAYPSLAAPSVGLATILYLGWKQNTWAGAGLATGAATEIGDISTATGNGAAIVWDFLFQGRDPAAVSSGVFSITGGASAISRGAVVALAPAGGGLDWATGGGLNWGVSGSSGLLTIDNPGTALTWPVFTIVGPITNPSITNPANGAVIAYSGLVDTGQTLVIDTNPFTRSVTLNGIDRSGFLSSAQWIEIPAGGAVALQFAGTGIGSCTATWQYAYK